LPLVARDLIVRFPAERLARWRGHEGLKWVDFDPFIFRIWRSAFGATLPLARARRRSAFHPIAGVPDHSFFMSSWP